MLVGTLVLALAAPWRTAMGQMSPSVTPEQPTQTPLSQSQPALVAPKGLPAGNAAPSPSLPTSEGRLAPPPLFDFKDFNTKFTLESLMRILRDSRHEGWVLAAYPDPKTSRPLIGAGFCLDVVAREHIQSDPLNPHTFIEPSSAQLWQAAGLDPERLERILDQFDRNLKTWKKKNYRKKIRTHKLPPELTEEEATRLLHVSAVQAVHNARAYCRDFDQLTASQQMALSQLVFQMGVNLEEFVQFLSVLNNGLILQGEASLESSIESQREHWKAVQQTLVESQWAKRYTSRAVAVIAMFDPNYAEDPRGAERPVQAALRPPVKHHRKKPRAKSVRAGNDSSGIDKDLAVTRTR
jgi:GH24 family phage-related lysozyme (muramidase)